MNRRPNTPETLRNLEHVREVLARKKAEREAREARPISRLVRAWDALTGADLDPDRQRR